VAVTGHVLDPHGRPLAGVDLYRRGTAGERGPGAGLDRTAFESVAGDWKRLGQSAADGSFKSLVSEDGWLAVGPPYIAVRTWPLDSGIYTDCVVVAVPAVAISGVVTDSEGHELAGVEISGFCERMPSYPDVLDHNGRPEFLGGETDSRGRFSIGRVPGCSAVVFSFAKPGYEKAELSCPTFDRSDYHLELRHPGQPGDHVFEGHVYDSDGVPVTDAMVGYGSAQATTDERGRRAPMCTICASGLRRR
jgi:hypothetical protein